MERHFIHEIEELRQLMRRMASVVDEQVDIASSVLNNFDAAQADLVREKDHTVDEYDNEIKLKCRDIIALFQPVATDLRFVLASVSINNNLERCGDIAVNIIQRLKKSTDARDILMRSVLPEMMGIARGMVRDAIDSYINSDINLSHTVLQRDKQVNKLNKTVFKQLVGEMEGDATKITSCSHLLIMAKHIERLADHATNISESVIFLIENEIIAHQRRNKRKEDL